jgi:hypothetical protein
MQPPEKHALQYGIASLGIGFVHNFLIGQQRKGGWQKGLKKHKKQIDTNFLGVGAARHGQGAALWGWSEGAVFRK